MAYRLEVEGVVDYYDYDWKLLWLRDLEGARTTFVPLASQQLPLKSGQRVSLQGTYVKSEGLSAKRVRIRTLAENVRVPVHRFDDDLSQLVQANAERISIEGYVNSAGTLDATHLRLQLVAPPHVFVVNIAIGEGEPITNFQGAIVRVEGILVITPDLKGNIGQADLWVPSLRNVVLTSELGTDPRFTMPLSRMESLGGVAAGTRLRVEGTVLEYEPGSHLVVRDEAGQMRVRTVQRPPIAVGQRVDAVGELAMEEGNAVLVNAWLRPKQDATPTASANRRRPVLRLADQVISLQTDEAQSGVPAQITGYVTWSNPNADFFFIADTSGGLRVRLGSGVKCPAVRDRVRVNGASEAGAFAPLLRADAIESLRGSGLPQAPRIPLEQALAGTEENRWVALEGYVREIRQEGSWTRMDLLTPSGTFAALLDKAPSAIGLLGSVVSVRGVCTATADENRQLTGIRLWVPSLEDVAVEEAVPVDVFGIPIRSVASLRRFSTLKQLNRRVHVGGAVTHVTPGRDLTIQDEDATLRVFSTWTDGLQLGDRVEVVGFPGRIGTQVVLNEAVVKRVAPGRDVDPIPLPEAGRLRPELDGRLVVIEGIVADIFSGEGELRLTMLADDAVFEARLRAEAPGLVPGSVLRLRGIYELRTDKDRQPRGFEVRLRTTADIEVLAAAPWWTVGRVWGLVALLSVVALLVMALLVALRRRLAVQTRRLREQLVHEEELKSLHSAIVANATDFIYATDAHGYFTSINEAGEKLTGYSRKDAMGQKVGDLITCGDGSPGGGSAGRDTLSEQTSEGRLKTRDGNLIWVEVSSRPLMEHGLRAGEQGIVRDISRRKKLEADLRAAQAEAERVTRAKASAFSELAHDLHRSLGAVAALAGRLRANGRHDPEQSRMVEDLCAQTGASQAALGRMLDALDADAGLIELEKKEFCLREVVDAVKTELNPETPGGSALLVVESGDAVDGSYFGDASRLRRVLGVLAGRAMSWTGAEKVVLSVSRRRDEGGEIELCFRIRASGRGLLRDGWARCFEPSEQEQNEAAPTGAMELASARQLITRMNGEMGVDIGSDGALVVWFTTFLSRRRD